MITSSQHDFPEKHAGPILLPFSGSRPRRRRPSLRAGNAAAVLTAARVAAWHIGAWDGSYCLPVQRTPNFGDARLRRAWREAYRAGYRSHVTIAFAAVSERFKTA